VDEIIELIKKIIDKTGYINRFQLTTLCKRDG